MARLVGCLGYVLWFLRFERAARAIWRYEGRLIARQEWRAGLAEDEHERAQREGRLNA